MAKDKIKQKISAHRHYLQNKDVIKTRASKYKKSQKQKLRAYLQEIKSVPCADCGITYPFYIMEFDHVRGKKRNNIADMVSQSVSLQTLLDEINKCEIVCANCHRERTYKRKFSRDRVIGSSGGS